MKKLISFLLPVLFGGLLLCSCGSDISKYTQDKAGFAKLDQDFKAKFGSDAYYTDVTIGFTPGKNPGAGLNYNVIVTEDPSSLKMQQWTYNSYSKWVNTAEVTLEMGGDANPQDFMFQLGDKISLEKVGELIEKSAEKLAQEKNIQNAVLNLAIIKTPDDMDVSNTRIVIMMKPENGGTAFNFYYDLDGNLLNFTY